MKLNLLWIILIVLVICLAVSAHYGQKTKSEFENSTTEISSVPLLGIIAKTCYIENCTNPDIRQCNKCSASQFDSCMVTLSAVLNCTEQLAQNQEIRNKCTDYVDSVKALSEKIKKSNEILLFIDYPFTYGQAILNSGPDGELNKGTDLTGVKAKGKETRNSLDQCLNQISELNH